MRFTYRGLDGAGHPVKGETAAGSPEEARRLLAQEDIQVTELRPIRPAGAGVPGKLSAADVASFCEQLANLTRSGLPLAASLAALAQDAGKPALRAALQRLADGVAAGEDLADLVERERRAFPLLLGSLVRAGAASGNLPETLRLAATHMWRMAMLRQRVLGMLLYPAIVVVLLAFVGSVVFLFITPEFLRMFAELNVELPALTKLAMAISEHYYIIACSLLGAAGVLVLLWVGAGRIGSTLAARRWVVSRLPLIGRIWKATYLARFCRMMCLLLSSGVPADRSLELLGDLEGTAAAAGAQRALAAAVREGRTMSDVMVLHLELFPQLLVWMVRSSEATGRLPQAFGEAADLYERDAERNIELMNSVLPPVLILVVASLIAVTLMGLFAPLIRIMQSLS